MSINFNVTPHTPIQNTLNYNRIEAYEVIRRRKKIAEVRLPLNFRLNLKERYLLAHLVKEQLTILQFSFLF